MIATIATLLITRAGLGPRLAKVSAWAILIALTATVLLIGKCAYDRSVIDDYTAKVEAADAKADVAGTVTAEQTKGTIDAGNERAKAAADRSDDPLAAGFDQLRSEAASRDKAAR